MSVEDRETLAGVREAEAEIARGDVVRGVPAVRGLRPAPDYRKVAEQAVALLCSVGCFGLHPSRQLELWQRALDLDRQLHPWRPPATVWTPGAPAHVHQWEDCAVSCDDCGEHAGVRCADPGCDTEPVDLTYHDDPRETS